MVPESEMCFLWLYTLEALTPCSALSVSLLPSSLLKEDKKFLARGANKEENLVCQGDVACLCGEQQNWLFDWIPARVFLSAWVFVLKRCGGFFSACHVFTWPPEHHPNPHPPSCHVACHTASPLPRHTYTYMFYWICEEFSQPPLHSITLILHSTLFRMLCLVIKVLSPFLHLLLTLATTWKRDWEKENYRSKSINCVKHSCVKDPQYES